MLNLKTKEIQGKEKIFQIDLKGVLDSATSESFISFIQEKIEQGFYRFIVNCKFLSFVTSSGFSTMIKLNNLLNEKKSALVYCELNSEIKMLFSIFGFDKKFLVSDDISSAEQILQAVFLPISKSSKSEEVEVGKYKEIEFSFDNTKSPNVTKSSAQETEDNLKERENVLSLMSLAPSDWIRTKDFPISDSLSEKIQSIQSSLKNLSPVQRREDVEITKDSPEEDSEFLVSLEDDKIQTPNQKEKTTVSEIESAKFHETIFHCESCGKPIRVIRSGKHKCPSCESIFHVRNSGSISYLEKLA